MSCILFLTLTIKVPPINYIFGNIHQIAKDDLGTMLDWLERCASDQGMSARIFNITFSGTVSQLGKEEGR